MLQALRSVSCAQDLGIPYKISRCEVAQRVYSNPGICDIELMCSNVSIA